MNLFKKPIAISLSPNLQPDDISLCLRTVFNYSRWKIGPAIKEAENRFRKNFNTDGVYSFNSGRSALYFILEALGIGDGDEVIIQAFTCVAVPDSILWRKGIPVYADIDESLNIDPKLLEQLITRKTKAIIVQHTFGLPAKINEIKKITQKYKIVLIEDCSHALGLEIGGKAAGKWGDAASFSFGRDKVISSIFGGMAVFNNLSGKQAIVIKQKYGQLKMPGNKWIGQQLMHPLLFSLVLPLYRLGLGKLLLFAALKIGLISRPVERKELNGGRPDRYPSRMPNALAVLLLNQLDKLHEYNGHRRLISEIYQRELAGMKKTKLPPELPGAVFLRYNILHPEAKKLLRFFKLEGIILGNWYQSIIDPIGVDLKKIGYRKSCCPKAEIAAETSLNLPTYPNMKEADAVGIAVKLRQYENR
ncbi:MAG: degt/dnrj/eryc1/strs aminotransferase [Candidatus Gottesmanbacteria bacterium GW2011_GWA2_43_14]|uniref:Degt/dnrj/eryc1/strs aminotransferase n=1 Tax=Candidatus Gottesmanbacteria bacterium GW2011_GWA2_43_14 TaxID=1618443 RepID=A0A0G1DLW1_9BACT|nr:MAG: degt/dnrj/eryc1/strs aminotransferase [Candidatus Gottesmanbacteria bacterium GW2011_GWA2_43_14]